MSAVPPEIRILSEDVANKIAAGEVVERPAAAVKELLENSIDAGATRIEIEFSRGGKNLIRVTDNGCGMTREQALMSLEPHATSKIRKSEDIFSISTYGFRGEALPSIASVSFFTLRTRPQAQPFGTEVRVRSGTVESVKDCGMACGTEIIVENLFASVPARRKFLKSDNVEASHIIRLCRLYALALPHISITLRENSRVIFRSEPNLGIVERVRRVFGGEISAGLIRLEKSCSADMSVEGAILEPGQSFPTSRNICAFINSRPVDSKTVFSAIKEAYRAYVPKGRYAAAFLFISLPYDSVDVNVHPSKREVRLRNEFAVRDFLFGAISARLSQFLADRSGYSTAPRRADYADIAPAFSPRTTLARQTAIGGDFAPHAKMPRWPDASPKGAGESDLAARADSSLQKVSSADNFDTRSHAEGGVSDAALENSGPLRGPSGDLPPRAENIADSRESLLRRGEGESQTDTLQVNFPVEKELRSQKRALPAESGLPEGWSYMGCALKKFAFFQGPGGVEIVNISAALRRVAYSRLMSALENGSAQTQMLLIPISLTLDRADAEALEANVGSFNSCGFKIENFGRNFYRVSAVPCWLDFSQVKSFVEDFIASARESSARARTLGADAFARAASAKVTSADLVCNAQSASALVSELLSCPSYATSPDGKPVIKEISRADLARMFNLSK